MGSEKRRLLCRSESASNWIEREDTVAGEQSGPSSETAAQLAALGKENAQLRRANEIPKTASALFAAAELDRQFI
jgi:transposase-like protein